METLRMKPLRADDYYGLALNFVSQKLYKRALDTFSIALTLDKRHERALYARAVLYGQLRRDAEAIRDFTALAQITPDTALVYYMRGLSYRLSADFVRAIADFSRVIELEPEHYEAYLQRAELFALLAFDEAGSDNLERAIADYDKALSLNPDELVAYKNRGIVRAMQGDNVGAIADCQHYLDCGGGELHGDQEDIEQLLANLRARTP